jgi:hypothetical protein
MARKKESPKPLFDLRHPFIASLENVCNEAVLMLGAVETLLKHDDNLQDGVRDILRARVAALRASLMSE